MAIDRYKEEFDGIELSDELLERIAGGNKSVDPRDTPIPIVPPPDYTPIKLDE